MLLIGDVHGKWTRYLDLIKSRKSSVQVGDLGVGFKFSAKDAEARALAQMHEGGHRFIRGNHDNPEACHRSPCWIPDGAIEGDTMFIGGAHSIDRALRIEGEDWWADEELDHDALSDIIVSYENSKPRVMVTHDAPDAVARHLFSFYRDSANESRTRRAFEIMLDIHKPDVWVFGHWHHERRRTILGTDFICLSELGTVEL